MRIYAPFSVYKPSKNYVLNLVAIFDFNPFICPQQLKPSAIDASYFKQRFIWVICLNMNCCDSDLHFQFVSHNCFKWAQLPWTYFSSFRKKYSDVLSEIAMQAFQLRCHNGPQLRVILVFMHIWLCLSMMDDIKGDHYFKFPWVIVCFVLVLGHMTWVPLTGHCWIKSYLALLFHLNNFLHFSLVYYCFICLFTSEKAVSYVWLEFSNMK